MSKRDAFHEWWHSRGRPVAGAASLAMASAACLNMRLTELDVASSSTSMGREVAIETLLGMEMDKSKHPSATGSRQTGTDCLGPNRREGSPVIPEETQALLKQLKIPSRLTDCDMETCKKFLDKLQINVKEERLSLSHQQNVCPEMEWHDFFNSLKTPAVVGEGSGASVIKGEVDGTLVAVKFPRNHQNFCREAVALWKAHQEWKRERGERKGSAHLVSLIFTGICRPRNVFFVIPLYDGGDLFNLLHGKEVRAEVGGKQRTLRRSHVQLSEEQKHEICRGLISAVNFMHNKMKMTHGDVKPGNIFLQTPVVNRNSLITVKLGDFGNAAPVKTYEGAKKEAPAESFLDRMEAYSWTPPEFFRRIEKKEGDVYCVGVVVREVHTGELPYEEFIDDNFLIKATEYLDLRKQGTSPLPTTKYAALDDVTNKCFEVDLEKRPTIEELQTKYDEIIRTSAGQQMSSPVACSSRSLLTEKR